MTLLTQTPFCLLSCRPRLRAIHGDRGTRDRSVSSSEEQEAAAPPASSSLSPPSLLSLPSFKDVGNEKGGEKEVWVSVFRYLSRAELLACMTVCKAWYKWYVTHFFFFFLLRKQNMHTVRVFVFTLTVLNKLSSDTTYE